MSAFVVRGRLVGFNRRKNKSKVVYQHCKNEGHSVKSSFQLMGYLNWFKGKKIVKGKKAVSANNVCFGVSLGVQRICNS